MYRSVLDLVFKQLVKARGTSSIVPFAECERNGERVFSAPHNSNAMRDYYENHSMGGHLVGIDVYCDGTTLAKSGSQSASAVRVRFVNIKGISEKWFDVGIAPSLVLGEKQRSDTAKRRERLHLFQRFLFAVLRDVMKASFDGVAFQDSMIFPRLVMVVSDQKHERPFFCLKSAGAFADCSLCDMSSRLPQKRKCPDASDSECETSITSDGDLQTMNNSPQSFVSGAASPRCAAASEGDGSDLGISETGEEKALDEEVLEIQTSRANAASRDVITTLKFQIFVAVHNRDGPTRISAPARLELRLAKRYLESVSALAYPPALAAFKGMGTAPFHLYRSIAFDRLHALDLGPLRELPDMAFKLFSSSDAYRGYSKANLVQTANQRFWDLPRSCRLGKLPRFA